MDSLHVSIVRFVDTYQPGIVECEFTDVEGHTHKLVDKVPYFTCEDIWETSQYPQPGTLACKVLNRWIDTHGRALVLIDIAEDIHSSLDGLSQFTILESQLHRSS